MSDEGVKLLVNEVFYSVQGESTWTGRRCVFIRLRGCHLRCHYCDTEYAFHEGSPRTISDLLDEVATYGCELVEVTGGEPLLQKGTPALLRALCEAGYTVLIETSGACDIRVCDERVIRIMDLKTPGSGEVERNLWSNVEALTRRDEVKFVLCDRADYAWAVEVMREHDLASRVRAVLMSAAGAMPPGRELAGVKGLDAAALAGWILADRLPVVMQTQLHRVIWGPTVRGV